MANETRAPRKLEPASIETARYVKEPGKKPGTETEETIYWLVQPVEGVKGRLALRARKSGSKWWLFRVSWQGRRVNLSLGELASVSYERAIELARLCSAAAQRGADPRLAIAENHPPAGSAALGKETALTFGAAVESYLSALAQRAADGGIRASYVQAERYTLAHEPLLKPWADRPIADITWTEAKGLLAAVRERATGETAVKAAQQRAAGLGKAEGEALMATARKRAAAVAARGRTGAGAVVKLQASLRRVWVHVRGDQDGVDRLPNIFADRKQQAKARKSDRYLSDDELTKVLPAMRELGYPFGHALLIALHTARRHEEVAGLEWSELRINDTEWRLPGARIKTGLRTEQDHHWLPLPPQATALLKECRKIQERRGDAGQRFVFSVRINAPVSKLQAGKDRIDEKVQLVKPWRVHDLRHTAKTLMQTLGIPEELRDYIANHHRPGVGRDYEHGIDRQSVIDAVEKLASKLKELEAGRSTAAPQSSAVSAQAEPAGC